MPLCLLMISATFEYKVLWRKFWSHFEKVYFCFLLSLAFGQLHFYAFMSHYTKILTEREFKLIIMALQARVQFAVKVVRPDYCCCCFAGLFVFPTILTYLDTHAIVTFLLYSSHQMKCFSLRWNWLQQLFTSINFHENSSKNNSTQLEFQNVQS